MRHLIRRRPRLTFFALGFLIAAAVYWLPLHLVKESQNLGGWISIVLWIAQIAPLIAIMGILGLRVARGPVIHAGSFIGGVLTHWVVVAGFFVFGDIAAEYWHRRRFDVAEWRRNDQSDMWWPARLTMVDDLLERHNFRGVTRDSVETLLGPGERSRFPEWDFAYYLGPERGLIRIDSETLVFKLAPDGRVADYRIVRD